MNLCKFACDAGIINFINLAGYSSMSLKPEPQSRIKYRFARQFRVRRDGVQPIVPARRIQHPEREVAALPTETVAGRQVKLLERFARHVLRGAGARNGPRSVLKIQSQPT